MTEAQLQEQVALYLRLQYPAVLFHSDFGSGIKLTAGQAIRQKRQNGGRRAWPDMFIAKPVIISHRDENGMIKLTQTENYSGLFLELKRFGTRLYKKDGNYATPHIKEQAELLEALKNEGYAAEFAVGFDEAKRIIDNYLKGGIDQTDTDIF